MRGVLNSIIGFFEGLFFRRSITSRCIFALEEIRIRAEENNITGVNDSVFPEVKRILYVRHKDVARKIGVENYTPDELALELLKNLVDSMITSGNHHTYRGLLSMSGNRLLQLYEFITSELVRLRYMTQEEMERDKLSLLEDIKRVG